MEHPSQCHQLLFFFALYFFKYYTSRNIWFWLPIIIEWVVYFGVWAWWLKDFTNLWDVWESSCSRYLPHFLHRYQFPPGKLFSSLFKTILPKKKPQNLCLCTISTGLMNFNFVCSVALDSEHTGGEIQEGPYQEEHERPCWSKVTSRITSGKDREVCTGLRTWAAEHLEEGGYGNLKLWEQTEVWNTVRCLPGCSCWTSRIPFSLWTHPLSPWACRVTQFLHQSLFLCHTGHTCLCTCASELTQLAAVTGGLLLAEQTR